MFAMFVIRTRLPGRKNWQFLAPKDEITSDHRRAEKFDRQPAATWRAEKATKTHPGRLWSIKPLTAATLD